jgi:UDP-glucose 4-epimerase
MRTMLDDFAPDVIFHLAGNSSVPQSLLHPARDLQSNLMPTLRLLENLKNRSSAPLLVFASSAAVYGEPSYVPVDEQHPTCPTSPYGVSKLRAEQYITVYSELYGIRAVLLRLFPVYGPGQRKQIVYDLM